MGGPLEFVKHLYEFNLKLISVYSHFNDLLCDGLYFAARIIV